MSGTGVIYKEEDYLQLSGLQHFVFCRRQWALIHIEHQWAENYQTADGQTFHSRAHDEKQRERRGDTLILRGIRVSSAALGVSGQCDVVEFYRSPTGISLQGEEGLWSAFPIEYKRGEPKQHNADELQLCAQAMCLEEMLCCEIPEGALFYGQTRRRQSVSFTEELREQVRSNLREMHDLYAKGYTPRVKSHKGCSACSLKELCLPALNRRGSASSYLRRAVEELS